MRPMKTRAASAGGAASTATSPLRISLSRTMVQEAPGDDFDSIGKSRYHSSPLDGQARLWKDSRGKTDRACNVGTFRRDREFLRPNLGCGRHEVERQPCGSAAGACSLT